MAHNLGEFLQERGFACDEPYTWARCFYKYQDCGPWASFLVKKKDASSRSILFAVSRNKSGKLVVSYDEEGYGDRDHLEPADLQAFGFKEDRTIEPSLTRSLKGYRKLVEDFAKETGTGYTKIEVLWSHPHREYDRHRVWIAAHQAIPEEVEDIYYSNIGKNITVSKDTECGCQYKDIGPHPDDYQETVYKKEKTDPKCPRCRGRGTVSIEISTGKKYEVTNENCIGITFGSIVEGSEANSGPFVHMFPFDMNLFDRDVEFMEKETSFYWERDNSIWLHARKVSDHSDQYALHNAWGDIKWDSDKPRSRKLKKALEEYSESEECPPQAPYEYVPLPGFPNWEIAQIYNDHIF